MKRSLLIVLGIIFFSSILIIWYQNWSNKDVLSDPMNQCESYGGIRLDTEARCVSKEELEILQNTADKDDEFLNPGDEIAWTGNEDIIDLIPQWFLSKQWIRQHTIENNITTTPKQAGKFSITFNEDNTYNATTDCNSMHGTYTISDGQAITLEPGAMTEMYCEWSQEMIFIHMLSLIEGFDLNDDGSLFLDINNRDSMIFK